MLSKPTLMGAPNFVCSIATRVECSVTVNAVTHLHYLDILLFAMITLIFTLRTCNFNDSMFRFMFFYF